MAEYVINKEYNDERRVEAAHFATVGDFIDFYTIDGKGDIAVTLRVRAAWVQTIERIGA